jgi:hypothetical protein
VWRAYVGRFKLERTFRFVKQFLNWTLPRVRHRCHKLTDGLGWWRSLTRNNAWLAHWSLIIVCALEKPLAEGKLTPYRVRRAFPSLLGRLPVLANLPKPCGRSPGRPKGRLSGHAPRYPAIKKAA